MTDPELEEMAAELFDALRERDLDPAHPPVDSLPPSEAAFREYRRRGGNQHSAPDPFAGALVRRVVEMGRM